MIPVLLVGLLAPGCGYHFSAGGGRLPGGGRALIIELAENQTTEPAAGAWLTRGLRREADRAGLVAAGHEQAARLSSRVLSVVAVPRGVSMHGGRFRAREQEVVVRVSLALEQAGGARRSFRLVERESYLSAPDLRGTETNRQLALQRALARLARRGIDRLTRSF